MAARQKVVQPGKQQKNPKVYPADKYPYMAKMPNQLPGDIQYFASHTKAIAGLRSGVKQLAEDMGPFSSEVRENCAVIMEMLGRLPFEGGTVKHLVDSYTGVTYEVELIRRQHA